MQVFKVDNYTLGVTSTDHLLLETIKNKTDGWKIRDQPIIYLPIKSGSKILNFSQYGIEYGLGAEEAIITVEYNAKKREDNIAKIRSQYGHDIKFEYDVKGIYKPLEHQKIMYNLMAYNSNAAILAEPGTCKTASYLWAIDRRIQKGQVRRALVITLNSLKKNVYKEAQLQVPHMQCIILDGTAQANHILNKSFKVAKKNKDYQIYIANYESMFSLINLFDDQYFDMVILDEAHRIGSYQSRQTKAIVNKFENTKYKYIITGTLNSNSSLSMFMPFRFMGPDLLPQASFYEFRRQHAVAVDPQGFIWKELSFTRGEVKQIINKVSVFFSKEECLDLPELIIEPPIVCEMEGEQAKAYNDMKTELIATIDDMCTKCDNKGKCEKSCGGTISTKNALTAITKLQQISSGFWINTLVKVHDDGHEEVTKNIINFKENPKLRLLIETIGNIPADHKIIVWAHLINSIDLICEAVEKAGYGECIKVYKDVDAYEAIQKFKDPKYRILVGNQSKMSAGHNIQHANYQIFFSNNYSYILRQQAVSREHRAGQTQKVTCFDLACKDSIDEIILEALKKKEELDGELVSLATMKRILK